MTVETQNKYQVQTIVELRDRTAARIAADLKELQQLTGCVVNGLVLQRDWKVDIHLGLPQTAPK